MIFAQSNASDALKYEEISLLVEDYYKLMLDSESKLYGSALHKSENMNLRRTWSVSSGIFYSMTLFTTIGYGTIACGTTLGKSSYSVLTGIPIRFLSFPGPD